MGLLSNPRFLLYVRYAQITFSLVFFVLLCYSSVHRGYWDNIGSPVGLGVFASIFTWTTAIYSIYVIHRNINLNSNKINIIVRIVQEVILVLAWAATAALMVKPKKKNFKKLLETPPWPTWIVATVLSFIEFLLFIFSGLLAVMSRGSGTKAAPPPYV